MAMYDDTSFHFAPRVVPTFTTAPDYGTLRELAARLKEGKTKKGELSAEARIAMVTALACGISRKAVSDVFGVSTHTVRAALQRWETRQSLTSRPRSGRPRKLTPEDESALLATADREHKSNGELALLFHVSIGTVRRILKKGGSAQPPGPRPRAGQQQQQQQQQQTAVPPVTTTFVPPPVVPGFGN